MIRTIATIASLLLAAACTPTVVDTSCTALVPITYSAKNDTPETVRSIRQHNAAWSAICK